MNLRYRLSLPIVLLVIALLVAQTLQARLAPPIHAQAVKAPELTATVTPSNTPAPTTSPTVTQCPVATQEPLWVDPVLSPTNLLTQTITIYAGRALTVTVSSEAGVVIQTVGSTWPARITIDLLPETAHHLTVKAEIVRTVVNGCAYGGYSLQTTRDRYGSLLTIVQSGSATVTPTVTPSSTPTAYPCPTGTPVPLWVDPVISPTNLLTQTITIYAGSALTVTVSSAAGSVMQTSGSTWPARITIDLLPQTTHHLTVKADIPPIIVGNCVSGNYSLSTTHDRQGNPLTIVQGASATVTPTPTATTTVPLETWLVYLPALLK